MNIVLSNEVKGKIAQIRNELLKNTNTIYSVDTILFVALANEYKRIRKCRELELK